MKWIGRSLGVGFLILILLVGGAWLVMWQTASDPAPEVHVTGLSGQVTIRLDDEGVPFITASTRSDAFTALGYLHAHNRMFQMELVRRLVSGRLSEWFGDQAVRLDERQRRLGFYHMAKQNESALDSTTRRYLDSYVAGINQWIEERWFHSPEFLVLMTRPEKWKPVDCLSILVYQTWFSHSLMDDDPAWQKLVELFGPDIIPSLNQPLPWEKTTLGGDIMLPGLAGSLPGPMTKASNSWVTSASKSANGAAMHASDPHLPVSSVPGFWYLVRIDTEDGMSVTGVTAPGLPLVAMGKSDSIAWSFTVASLDVLDYYRFRQPDGDSLSVVGVKGVEPLQLRTDSIRVKGEDHPRFFTLESTPVGPVISKDSLGVIALRWAGFDFSPASMMKQALSLPDATDFESFRQAVTGFGALDVNWVYSDRTGHIGYQLGTPVPVREKSVLAFTLLDGANPDHRWKGYLSLQETPHKLDPASGWLASCNNRIAGPDFPHDLPGYYDPYRYLRISRLLGQDTVFTVADFHRFQADSVSSRAVQWKSLLSEGLRREGEKVWADRIDQWDGTAGRGSREATLFNRWWVELKRQLLEDSLGDEWQTGREAINQLLSRPVKEVTDHLKTPGVESLSEVSGAAAKAVLASGPVPEWGTVSLLEINHPLSVVPGLNAFLGLNRGPFSLAGDGSSLNASFSHYDAERGVFLTDAGPSMRFVLDWSSPDSFSIIGNLGQSGNPFSVLYDNWLDNWLQGNGHVVGRSPGSVQYEFRLMPVR